MITELLKFTVKKECLSEAIEYMREQALALSEEEGCVMSKVFWSKTDQRELYMLRGWKNRKSIEMMRHMDLIRNFRETMDSKIECPPEFFDWEKII